MNDIIYPSVSYMERQETDDVSKKLIFSYSTKLRVLDKTGIIYLVPLRQTRKIEADTIRRVRQKVKLDCLQELHEMVYYYEHVPSKIDKNFDNLTIYKIDPNQETEVDRILKLLEP